MGFHIITAGFLVIIGVFLFNKYTKRTLFITDTQYNVKDVSGMDQYTKLHPEQGDTVLELVNSKPYPFTPEDKQYILEQIQSKFPAVQCKMEDVDKFAYRYSRYGLGQLYDYYSYRFTGMDKGIAVFNAKGVFYNEDPLKQQHIIVLQDIN